MAVAPRLTSAWNREELLQLVQAWEDVVEAPRDRLILAAFERAALHERFCAITNSTRRSLSSVTRQHHRLCTSFRLIVDTNAKNRESGAPTWFDMPAAQQQELRRLHAKKEKGMTAVTPELFQELERICAPDAAPPKFKAQPNRPKKPKPVVTIPPQVVEKAVKTGGESSKSSWTQREWELFVDAWKEAVDGFVDFDDDQKEKLKVPNWLIRQQFVALGGSEDVTVGSITAKKRCVIHAYNFVRECVSGMRNLDGSDWFRLSFNERYRLQRKLIGPKSSQRLGCEISQAMFNTIASILEKEEALATTTGRKRKRMLKRKASVSSESSLDEASVRSPTPPPSDDDVSDRDDSPTRRPLPTGYTGDDPADVDEKVIESLLDAQNARFEQLLRDLREERMEERKQNQSMLLAILHQRTPPGDPQQSVSYMEALVTKQQEQLMDLFAQMHKERQQEREDFHAMLRQLRSRPRL